MTFMKNCSPKTDKFREWLRDADAVIIGAGAGLSAAAGYTYSGERFRRHFADFEKRFGFHDMYTGGFYPFPDEETYWAYWSRYIFVNRYDGGRNEVYADLLSLVKDKDHFVITTNVDHCFQRAGFDKDRLFYTQGDYGLFQCSVPCREVTYDNEEAIRRMAEEQRDMRVPTELLPRCPVCGKLLIPNLRADDSFVEDEGWHRAAERYTEFLRTRVGRCRVLFLEPGVGMNTPGIIKFPFLRMTAENENTGYVCVNLGMTYAPEEISGRSLCFDTDIAAFLRAVCAKRAS